MVGEVDDDSWENLILDFLSGDWKQLSNGPWERSESIPVLEGRAIVCAKLWCPHYSLYLTV